MRYWRLTFTVTVAVLVSACSTAPPRPPAAHDARMAVDAPRLTPHVASNAPVETHDEVEAAELSSAHAESERRGVLETQARARIAQQQAAAAQQRAHSAGERRALGERQLRDLFASSSDRGTVVTLNDVLFESNSATLRPGGQRLVARLAEVLREYPEREIAIEGFTDSVGSDAQNQDLSELRAASVRQGLLDAGVDGPRVLARGYGQAFPVASNDTREGRLRNRRVEVVIGNDHGSIAPRVARFAGG